MPSREAKPAAGQLELDWSPTPPPTSGIVVSRSPEQQRLDRLTKEHERLLDKVAKKRAALQKTERAAREVVSDFVRRAEPLRDQIEAAAREIHDLFEHLLGSQSRLGKRSKVKIRRVYQQVMMSLPPELRRSAGTAAEENDEWGAPERGQYDPGPPGHGPHGPGAQGDAGPPPETGYSAPKHDGKHKKSLRDLFRRLATALHPDKVQDEAEKLDRTAVMKDITQAYEAGDLARLVELERSHLASIPMGDDAGALARRIEQLSQANSELRRQLSRLGSDQRAVKQSVPFPIDLRGGKKARARAEAAIDEALAEFELEVDGIVGIRDFVREFAQGKMTLQEFLDGPGGPHDDTMFDDPDAILDALLAELVEQMGDPDDVAPIEKRKKKGNPRKSTRKGD